MLSAGGRAKTQAEARHITVATVDRTRPFSAAARAAIGVAQESDYTCW